jgi:hypothetical protein
VNDPVRRALTDALRPLVAELVDSSLEQRLAAIDTARDHVEYLTTPNTRTGSGPPPVPSWHVSTAEPFTRSVRLVHANGSFPFTSRATMRGNSPRDAGTSGGATPKE